jgi:hypothetical protein
MATMQSNVKKELPRILTRIRASGKTDVQQFNIEMHKLMDERKFDTARKLWDTLNLNNEKIVMEMDDDMKIKMIFKLCDLRVLPSIAFSCAKSLSKENCSFSLREKLHCKIIKVCGKQKNWKYAKAVFESFEKKTTRMKGALANAYLMAGRADLVRPQDLLYDGEKFSRLTYLHNMMKYSMYMGDRENAFMYLEKLKPFAKIDAYYLHKTEIMYTFKMFDGNYILMHYNASKEEKDKEKVEFLRKLAGKLILKKGH